MLPTYPGPRQVCMPIYQRLPYTRPPCAKKHARDVIVRALVERAEQLSQMSCSADGTRLVSYVFTFCCLAGCVDGLLSNSIIRSAFDRADYLRRFATAFFTISATVQGKECSNTAEDQDFILERIAHCMDLLVHWATERWASPPLALSQFMVEEGNLFKLAEMLIRSYPSFASYLRRPIGRLCRYLYSSKLFHASNISRCALSFGNAAVATLGQANHEDVVRDEDVLVLLQCAELLNYLDKAYAVHSHKKVHLCHNVARLSLKACNRCPSAIYCSRECQIEDWSNHTFECAALASQYHVEKRLHYSVSHRLRQDQLRILDTVANMELPSPPELNRMPRPPPPLPSDPPLTLFEFFVDEATLRRSHYRMSTMLGLESGRVAQAIELRSPKMVRYMQEVQENRDAITLIAGQFMVNFERMVTVFALMSYDPNAPDGDRYSIASSFSCISARDPPEYRF
ncbi:hypothetical protein NMY22_g2272 [Coprinellus aureogranulatus]|nr:hypothetical protein NMY22_g2272 [Coprinellus aureogranulatus]